jgi:hypothetical protein
MNLPVEHDDQPSVIVIQTSDNHEALTFEPSMWQPVYLYRATADWSRAMIIFLVILSVVSSLVSGPQDSNKPQRCEIVISTATPTVKIGSAPVVTVKLTNNSSHVLDASGNWSDLTNVDPNWLFDVHDSAEKALPRRVFKLLVPATGKAIFRNVSPGGSIVDNVDLTPLYEFKKAGEYRIQVSREVQKELGGTIKSNIITVTVTQ